MILSNDGAEVRVLRAECNGQASTDVGAILTGFEKGGTAAAISDVSFVEDETWNVAIFAATTDNFIVLADMNKFLAGEPDDSTRACLHGARQRQSATRA